MSIDKREVFQEKRNIQKVTSDLETFDGQKRKIEIKLGPDGYPRAVAFFDIDGCLGDFDFIHGENIKKVCRDIVQSNVDLDELSRVHLAGTSLGTTYRVFHRLMGIYKYGHEEWKDPQKYLKWFLENPDRQKEIDEAGPLHDEAAELSKRHSKMGAQVLEELFRDNPRKIEQTKIQPVFYLAQLYKRMGIPMAIMTANDDDMARAICKYLGLADSFIALADQKDFRGGKDEAMEYLIRKLKEKGVPVPKHLIVVGDSLHGDIGSGSKFKSRHDEYDVSGVLVGKGNMEEMQQQVKNKANLNNILVEVINPELVTIDSKGMPELARYRRKYNTKL